MGDILVYVITAKHVLTIHCAFIVFKKGGCNRRRLDCACEKPNTTSIVWNYFGLEANKGGTPKA